MSFLLSLHQQLAFDLAVHERRNMAILGKAGGGKSFLIQAICSALLLKKVAVQLTATTGIAASLLPNAFTLHSFLGAGIIRDSCLHAQVYKACKSHHLRKRLSDVDCLIIDEISMADAVLLEFVHLLFQRIHGNEHLPFGGKLQVIVVGDFAQLPPVRKPLPIQDKNDERQQYVQLLNRLDFCFQHPKWNSFFPLVVCLDQVFRQSDSGFVDLLNRLRTGQPSTADVTSLNLKAQQDERLFKRLKKLEDPEEEEQEEPTSSASARIIEAESTENMQSVYKFVLPELEKYIYKDVADMVCQYLFLNQLEDYVFLYGVNEQVDRKNKEEMDKLMLKGRETHDYKCQTAINGANERNQRLMEMWIEEQKRNNLAKPEITLTIGCKVMLTANLDMDKGLVNGRTGIVVAFDITTHSPIVEFPNSDSRKRKRTENEPGELSGRAQHVINPHTWQFIDVSSTVADKNDLVRINPQATYRQLPLRLAFGMSTHKSQGTTLSHVVLDAQNIWAPGQFYVAMSRAKSLHGILLLNFKPACIKANPLVQRFYTQHEAKTRLMLNQS